MKKEIEALVLAWGTGFQYAEAAQKVGMSEQESKEFTEKYGKL